MNRLTNQEKLDETGREQAETAENQAASSAESAGQEQAAAAGEAQAQQDTADSAQPQKTEAELLQEKLDTMNDRLLRTLAEYDNFRKRSQREKDAIYPQATAAAVAEFVPIFDTFERALSAPCTDEKFKQGVEMILNHFKEAIKKLGVEEFAEAGDKFNPEMHNAVMHVEDDTQQAGVIVEVFQKGYKLGERIIRHAMVKVAN